MAWTANESYSHKLAKELLRDAVTQHARQSFRFWRQRDDGKWCDPIEISGLRDPRVLVEYPIYLRRQCHWTEQSQIPKSYPPGRLPMAVADIAVLDGTQLVALIEICHKNPVSDDKLHRLRQVKYIANVPIVEVQATEMTDRNALAKHHRSTATYVRSWRLP